MNIKGCLLTRPDDWWGVEHHGKGSQTAVWLTNRKWELDGEGDRMLNRELFLHTTRKARKAILLQALLGTDPRKRDLLLEPGSEHT